MKLARSSQGREAGQGKRLEVEADAAEQCSEAAHNCLLFLMCNVGSSRRQVRGKCVEYQEGFRLPNNNVVSQGGRKEERQTISTLLKALVNVQPPHTFKRSAA